MKELDKNELSKVEGGIIPILIVAGTLALWGGAFYGAFMAGYDAAKQ